MIGSMIGQIPYLSDYTFSPSTINPALTAYAAPLSAHAHYHRAYTSLLDGAYTATLNVDHAFHAHHAGIQVSHDIIGIDEQNMAIVRYAYFQSIAGGTLSAGIQFSGNSIKRSLTQTHPTSTGDPTLQADMSKTIWNAGIGLAWISSHAYFAVSTPSLFPQNISASGDVDDAAATTPFYLHGMYRIIMDQGFEVRPVMWSELQNGQPMVLDLQAQFIWQEHIKATLGYRNTENWIAGIHARFHDRYTIGYLYDLHLPTGSAAHEFVLGFDLSPIIF
jgi:type IX secretion system PorP/SprF family membrane protein